MLVSTAARPASLRTSAAALSTSDFLKSKASDELIPVSTFVSVHNRKCTDPLIDYEVQNGTSFSVGTHHILSCTKATCNNQATKP